VHRFTDPAFATLSLRMRTGDDPGEAFDALHRRGEIVIHASEAERTAVLAETGAAGDLVIADTREQVADLNAAIRDHNHGGENTRSVITTAGGHRIGLGDRVATRRNDPGLQVANRQTWTVAGIRQDGSLLLHGHGRDRQIPADYATRFVELAYATTVHGAQGSTFPSAHVPIGDTTGAASAYVAMTRSRHTKVAHLVAESVDEARRRPTATWPTYCFSSAGPACGGARPGRCGSRTWCGFRRRDC
jgi:ATP-dependent exoDNAse (exonuclease V) alpha subunit